ncbi:hypothetical protein Tco_0111652 [Tanacetum coccineum]
MILSGANNRPPMLDNDLEWVTRTKKYVELSVAEKIQADCDMKATNIILQGLPADIYSLVNHHRVAKDLWERVQLLMQACKRLHTTNFDQLHAYLAQHELHANEVRLQRERNQDPLAFVANQQMTPPHFNTYQSSYNNPQLQQQFPPSQYGSIHPTQHYSSTYPSQPQFNHSSIPPSYPYQSQMNHQTSYVPQIAYQSPQAPIQPMTELPLTDSGLAVLVFSSGDDPIACLNKAIAFLTVIASSRFPSTNNQLRISSNPRNQATIRVTLLVLKETMQVDSKGLLNAKNVKTEDLDTYDYDCDDISNAKVVLMANISNYGSDVISEEKLNRLSEDFGKRFTPQQELSAEQAFWFHISNPKIESSNKQPSQVKFQLKLPKKRTTPDARTKGEWGFEHTKAVFNNEIILFLKSLKDIFNVFDKDLLNEIMEVQTVFNQMDAAVQQSSVDKQCLEIAKK